MNSKITLIISILITFLILSSCSTNSQTKKDPEGNNPQVDSSLIDSSLIVDSYPDLPGLINWDNCKLEMKTLGKVIETNRYYDDEEYACEDIIITTLSGSRKERVKVAEYDEHIGWLFPSNTNNTVFYISVGGNRCGFSVIEFDIIAKEPLRTLFDGIGIVSALREDNYLELVLDSSLDIANGIIGRWCWKERYDFNGNKIYSGDSLFIREDQEASE